MIRKTHGCMLIHSQGLSFFIYNIGNVGGGKLKNTRVFPLIFGFFILFIGIIILLNIAGIHVHGGSIFAIFILFIGYQLLKRKKKVIGYIFIAFGSLILLSIFDLIGFIISIALIFYGYRMIRSKQKEEQIFESNIDNERIPKTDHVTGEGNTEESSYTYRFLTPQKKHTLIGSCLLTGSRWELRDLDIWYGIGEVKIDLSRANIPENKSTIIINGWIGDVDIFVPYDLDVSIIARVGVGEIKIFGNKESGLNRSTAVETNGYHKEIKRVEIVVNLFVGDIDVNYL